MAEAQPAARRATLVVGYGAFGRAVLERLLASTAPRGVLDWEEPQAGGGAGERTLRDLALVHVPDRLAGSVADQTAAGSAASGLLGELYRQIRAVVPQGTASEDFVAAVRELVERLLSASGRAGRRDALPLGLDLVLVAQPDEPEVLGLLDPMLATALDALANNANLTRAAQGSPALTALTILDFESYWDGSAAGERLRRALAGSLSGWERRRADGRPAPSRLYLVDGRTADGIRDARHRIDEISLFLELLLFESQRGGELQSLWRPGGLAEPPLAAFGVRSMERSAGLLSRLAAARFAVGWLEAMAGDAVSGASAAGSLVTRLAAYRAEELDRLAGGADLTSALAAKQRELEGELTETWRNAPEQADAVVARAEEATRGLLADLGEQASRRAVALDQGPLATFRRDVAEAVSADLHHPREPQPVGAVIRELEKLAAELGGRDAGEPQEPATRPGETAAGDRLRTLGARFESYRRGRVPAARLHGWWPLWAAVVAAGTTPLLARALAEVPPPDGTDLLLTWGYAALEWARLPATLALLLFGALWALAAGIFQRRIVSLQERGDALYLDPDRGRLADAVRAELGPDGSLGRPLHEEVAGAISEGSSALREVVRGELGRATARLRERRREMLWLRDELRDFLTLHGVELTDAGPQLDRRRRDATGIRVSVERIADLERVLEANPPTPARFRATQAELRPLEGWDERYSDAFLDPLAFLERLSRLYAPAAAEESGAGDPERDFLEFLRERGRFDLAFVWPQREELPVDRRFCVLPAVWKHRSAVRSALAEHRIGAEGTLDGPDGARAYLLRLQSGVPAVCLEAPATPIRALAGDGR